ncbi:MAG: septum formation initiator family protein [Acidobacteriota bacterium]
MSTLDPASPSSPTDDRSPRTTRSLKAAVVGLLLVLTVAGLQSWRVLSGHRAHAAQLEIEIEASRERIERLRQRIDRVENDPATLERLAREELGWVHDGDLVIVLPAERHAARSSDTDL